MRCARATPVGLMSDVRARYGTPPTYLCMQMSSCARRARRLSIKRRSFLPKPRCRLGYVKKIRAKLWARRAKGGKMKKTLLITALIISSIAGAAEKSKEPEKTGAAKEVKTASG